MAETPLNILLFEDVAADAELVQHELKKSGLKFVAKRVDNKEAFAAALDDFDPDVILSDYSLPGFNGLNAFMFMQQKNRTVPFLLVTGALPEATVIEIVKAGIDDYILKDNLKRLPGALQNAYEKRSVERKNGELNELRKKFIEIMAHQLRTPLTVVNWQLEHVLSGKAGALKPGQDEVLHIAYDASQTVVSRIADLLMVIDIEEGRVALEKRKVSLESLWQSVMIGWKTQCKVKGMACDYRPPAHPLKPVRADAEKLRLVFQKLADNSVIYTPQKGTITAALRHADGALRFEITDTGAGIPHAEQARIFTPFFRASNASTILPDASGVGLAIAKHMAEQHGGTLGFTSQEGKGSTFWLELPDENATS